MKRWAEDMMAAYEACDKERILGMLNMGFPPNTPMRKKTSSGRVLVGRTYCVHLAAEYGFLDVLKSLVGAYTDIELLDSCGRTPLLIAADIGQLDSFKYLLHEAHAKISARDKEENTVLHLSSQNCHFPLVQYLVETLRFPQGLRNGLGKTALEMCEGKQEHAGSELQTALDQMIAYLSAAKHTGFESSPILPTIKEKPVSKTHNIHKQCIHRFKQADWAKEHGIFVQDTRRSDDYNHKLTFQRVAHETLAPIATQYHSDTPVERCIESKCQEIYDRFVGSHVIYIAKEKRSRPGHTFPGNMRSTATSDISMNSAKTKSVT